MIAPDIAIVGLEPLGFAHLCGVVSRRERARGSEVQVLHERGDVLRVVHSEKGSINEFHESFDEPSRRATEILQSSEVARVVMLDREGLGDLSARLVELAKASATQTELLWKSSEVFWSHPAIATAPDRPRSLWNEISKRLSSLGDDFWVLLAAWRSDSLFLTLAAHLENGNITTLTSVDGLGGPRPSRGDAPELLEWAETLGNLPIVLFCDLGDLDSVLMAADVTLALATLVDEGRTIEEKGIRELCAQPA